MSGIQGGKWSIPRHIAMIMDGNGRWAKAHFLPRIEGHRRGAQTVRMVVEECRRWGVRYLTLYAFSTENWKRPEMEVQALMKLLHYHLVHELDELHSNGIRIRLMGELQKLPRAIQEAATRAVEHTKGNTAMDLILAVSYGGRTEILQAAQKIAQLALSGELDPAELSEEQFRSALYLGDVPDPDLLVRTSNEQRISNFLLWQMAYTEIVVTERSWPEFSQSDFLECLQQFSKRDRRFGCTSEQLSVAGVLQEGAKVA